MLQGGVDKCGRVARAIGHGSLPLGRLCEGHVNAPKLIAGFGSPSQIEAAARRWPTLPCSLREP